MLIRNEISEGNNFGFSQFVNSPGPKQLANSRGLSGKNSEKMAKKMIMVRVTRALRAIYLVVGEIINWLDRRRMNEIFLLRSSSP